MLNQEHIVNETIVLVAFGGYESRSKTSMRPVRSICDSPAFRSVGRPRLTQELRDVVTRIGSENLLWGYKRIAGELKKLGLYAGANSVAYSGASGHSFRQHPATCSGVSGHL
jgi:hypothetical protein